MPRLIALAMAAVVAGGRAAPALADPADDVFMPYAAPGARELAWSAGEERDRHGGRERQQQLSLGWAPDARWFGAVYGAWAAQDGAGWRLDEWSALAHAWLLAPGPLQVGLFAQVDKPRDRDEGTGFTVGPTLQLDTDEVQLNLDPRLEWHAGAAERAPASLGYQWQAKALLGPRLEWGAQGFGELGPWRHWAPGGEQSHVLGPAVFAKWMLADGHPLRADAAWLVGVGGATRAVLRLRVEHEF
jgi:hypothetical protein